MSQISATEWIWRDGEFIPWADAHVHVLSHSMQFGSSAFEGIRCYHTPQGPAIFRLREHLMRLVNSVKIYRMELAYSVDALSAACCELVKRNRLTECYLRPMVLRGYGAAGMVPFASPIEVYLPCWPWGAYLGADALELGVDACVSTWHRFAPNTIPSLAKVAGNYLGGQLIKMEALANGFAEAIALNPSGTVSEGSGQNIFLVMDGTLVTTPLDGSMLAGITRDSIVRLAQREGLAVREQIIPREMLYIADEMFFTGTAAELTPVRSVDRIKVGAGTVGPVTRHLQTAFLDIANGRATDTFGWLTPVR